MSILKLSTTSELESFLKVLVEESVKSAERSVVEERDAEQERFKKEISLDVKRFKGIKEQETEEPESDAPPADSDNQDVDSTEAGEEEAPDAGVEATFYTIRDAINNIRSGSSLKSTEVKQNLEQYVGRLDGGEREVLHTYLRALAEIMHNEVTGGDAQDPSDPPVSLSVRQSEDEPDDEKAIKKKTSPEDTSPPIKVGTKQKTESIRRKVLELMKG